MTDGKLEGINITLDDVRNPPKDWVTTHLESKGKPVWTRTIDIDGHVITLTNYDAEFDFTERHQQELIDFVRKAREFNPELIANFKRLIFDDYQPASRYADEEKFPSNGMRLNDGVLLFKRGQRSDIKHRTDIVSNFQGTIAHECFHFIGGEYGDAWKQAFDWHYVGENLDDWELIPVPDGSDKAYKNIKTGKLAYQGQYTNHPEWCVTDYARMAWDDDFADSGVIALFEPSNLEAICTQKLAVLRNIKPQA